MVAGSFEGVQRPHRYTSDIQWSSFSATAVPHIMFLHPTSFFLPQLDRFICRVSDGTTMLDGDAVFIKLVECTAR